MATLLILNHQPYDGTDVTWNALRLARQLNNDGVEVRIFLMNLYVSAVILIEN